MSLFLTLPQDLKREASQYLHKKYYEVVLDELLLMTKAIKGCMVPEHQRTCNCNKIVANAVYVTIYGPDDRFVSIPVARWDHIILNDFKRQSIQTIKNELSGH